MRSRRLWIPLLIIVPAFGVVSNAFTNCAHFESQTSYDSVAGTDYCLSHAGEAACANPAPVRCVFNGVTVAEGGSVAAYLVSTPPAGQACAREIRVCRNGVLSGGFTYAKCDAAASAPAACLFNGLTIPSGQSVTAYRSSSEASCTSESRACANGVLTGSFPFARCQPPTQPASCLFDGRTVPHGQSVTAFATSAVPAGGTCASSTRTCFNGALTGTGDFASCNPAAARSCLFDGKTIPSGGTVSAFATGQVAFGGTCVATARTCVDGALSGAGDYAGCQVAQPAACLINGQTVPSGGAISLYLGAGADLNGQCPTEVRTCANGILSGSATFGSCGLPSPDDGARVLLAQTGAQFNHVIGHPDPGGTWSVTTADGAGVMTYGPYVTTLPPAATLARFKLAIDNNAADNNAVAILDVFDSTAGLALITRTLRRQDFQNAGVAQNFALDFAPPAGHAIEFRVQALGLAALTHQSTEVRAEGLQRDILLWVDSGLADAEYVAVHAEGRQCDPPYDACGPWTSRVNTPQPFKSRWDNARLKMYWRKDDFAHDFFGEIWNLTPAGLTLRQETTPYLSDFDAPGPSSDWTVNGWVQPGRFRLFSLDHRAGVTQGVNPWPGAEGRLLAPRYLDWTWSATQTLNTFRCYTMDQFTAGQCPLYQYGVVDTKISVDVIDDFSSDFDGANVNDGGTWQPIPEFRTFERAIVIKQEINGQARERFFFAERGGRYYGIVRWDNSVYDAAHDRFVVTERAHGMRRANDHFIGFDGMINRGLMDR